jgi:transcriptional regulator of met regulon
MAEYALLIDGTFKEIRQYAEQPIDIPHKLVTWHDVVRQQRPESTLTQDPVDSWSLVNGVWTQVWTMVDVRQEEATHRQQQAVDEATAAEIKKDAFVNSFVGMTPAQVEAYVTNNTANLAQVRTLLTKMALMLLIMAKREYRE